MKRLKRLLAFILCLLLVQTVFTPAVQEVKAATAQGLVYSKTSGKYYYYDEDGKKVTNDWRTAQNGQRYYFGKTGAAYAAEVLPGYKYNIAVKKINGKYYGFDNKGRMVKGLYIKPNENGEGIPYFFSKKTGIYSSSVTAKYRKAVKYMTNASAIRNLLGKPKKTEKSSSCMMINATDLLLIYSHYEVSLVRDNATKKEIVLGIYPR